MSIALPLDQMSMPEKLEAMSHSGRTYREIPPNYLRPIGVGGALPSASDLPMRAS